MGTKSRYKILVVEDDIIIAEDISQALDKVGYDVISTAESGEEAIKKATQLSPDLVLMDIVLKGAVDGIKAASHIMKNLDIPVVYLTSHSDTSTFRRAKETGPFGYLMKPYEERDLGATVEMALYKHTMESRLKGKQQWLTIILKSMGEGVIVTDANGNIGFMNPASETMLCLGARDCAGKPLVDILTLLDEETYKPLADPSALVLADKDFEGGSMLIARHDKTRLPIDGSAYPIRGEMGEAEGAVFVFKDVTEKRAAEKKIVESERFLNTIFDSIHDPFCILDRDYKVIRANDAYALLKGVEMDEVIDHVCVESLSGSDSLCVNCIVQTTFAEAKANTMEKPQKMPDDSMGWVEIFTYPVFDDDGDVSHVIEYTRNITERKQSDEERQALIKELEYLSTVDPLSGLLNRRALMEFLNAEFDRAGRYGRKLSLLLCDVDRFKKINDTLGHAAGDEAIRVVSDIFRSVARKTDVVGRYGGDEFMVIMPETSSRGAEDLANRLIEATRSKTFRPTPKTRRKMTLSIGVVTMDSNRDTVDSFVSRADAALYESKHAGRDRATLGGK